MKKVLIAAAIASLFAAQAFAQAQGPGEDAAVPSKKATAAEKSAAKAHRKEQGKTAAKEAKPGDDQPSTTASKKTSKEEKSAAKSKRKAEGAAAAKAPKDQTTGAAGSQ